MLSTKSLASSPNHHHPQSDLFSGSIDFSRQAGFRKVAKHQVIYAVGEFASSIYYLKEGRVKISQLSEDGKEIILDILQAGEIFGEMAATGEQTRDHIAEATEDAVIGSLSVAEFTELMRKDPAINMQLAKLIGVRMLRTQERLQSLVFMTAAERVCQFIKDMIDRYGRKVGHEQEVKLRLTHQDIANFTATTRQTVTLVLRQLEKKNIILYDRTRILVRDYEALAA